MYQTWYQSLDRKSKQSLRHREQRKRWGTNDQEIFNYLKFLE